jgi:hypothetical protein
MSARLYILSRPAVAEGLATFLEHRNFHWPRNPSATPAETLIAFLARLAAVNAGGNASDDIAVSAEVLEHVRWTFLLRDVAGPAVAELGGAPAGGADTAVAVTAGAGTLREFMARHGEGDADARIACALIFHMLSGEAPILTADLRLEEMPDGSPVLRPAQPQK